MTSLPSRTKVVLFGTSVLSKAASNAGSAGAGAEPQAHSSAQKATIMNERVFFICCQGSRSIPDLARSLVPKALGSFGAHSIVAENPRENEGTGGLPVALPSAMLA